MYGIIVHPGFQVDVVLVGIPGPSLMHLYLFTLHSRKLQIAELGGVTVLSGNSEMGGDSSAFTILSV